MTIIALNLAAASSLAHADDGATPDDDQAARSALDDVNLRPSLSVAVGTGSSEELFFHSWLGLNADHAKGVGLYLGLGLEIDVRERPARSATTIGTTSATLTAMAGCEPGKTSAGAPSSPCPDPTEPGTYMEVWPTVRVGFSYTDPADRWAAVRLYALAAFRPMPGQSHRGRLGFGVTAPALLPLAEAGIPSVLELTIDGGADDGIPPRFSARFGWGF